MNNGVWNIFLCGIFCCYVNQRKIMKIITGNHFQINLVWHKAFTVWVLDRMLRALAFWFWVQISPWLIYGGDELLIISSKVRRRLFLFRLIVGKCLKTIQTNVIGIIGLVRWNSSKGVDCCARTKRRIRASWEDRCFSSLVGIPSRDGVSIITPIPLAGINKLKTYNNWNS